MDWGLGLGSRHSERQRRIQSFFGGAATHLK